MREQLVQPVAARPGSPRTTADVPLAGRSKIYGRIRRPLDFVLALALLTLTSPVHGLLAVLIRLDSPGPALFRQERVGQGGKHFTIFKFRTMQVTAPAYSYKVPVNDSRVTRLGRWLRRSGLDELPQLWNVLRGDMALIGPRPELPFIVERYEEWQHERHRIRPGITGWWQVNHRNEVPMHLNIDYDIYYVRNQSTKLDARIVWRTVRVMARGAAEATVGKNGQHPAQTPASIDRRP